MIRNVFLPALLIGIASLFHSCTKNDDDKTSTSNIEIGIRYWDGDNQIKVSGNAFTIKSNRHFEVGFQEYSSDNFKTLEVTKEINGVSSVCTMITEEGEPRTGFSDWPATTTIYTIKVSSETDSKTFGPYTCTVESANTIVRGSASMGDQFTDYTTRGGALFQSRHVGWGGGYTAASYSSVYAEGTPRLIDFINVSQGQELKAVSPDLAVTMYNWPNINNDCGFLTTTFEAYTGSLSTSNITLAEIEALTINSTATSIVLKENEKFVYRTSDGKKGLIEVGTIVPEGGGYRVSYGYACAQ